MRDKISVGTVFVELAYCIISEKSGHWPSCLDAELLTIAIFALVSSVSGILPSFKPGKVDFPCPILAARLVKVAGSVES